MQIRDKILYHQIHPAKLLADFVAGIVALYPLWLHEIVLALVIIVVPPIVASLLVLNFVRLEPYRHSPLGDYVARNMTSLSQALRLLGYAVMALSAWYHLAVGLVAGFAIVVYAWLRGILVNRKWRSRQ